MYLCLCSTKRVVAAAAAVTNSHSASRRLKRDNFTCKCYSKFRSLFCIYSVNTRTHSSTRWFSISKYCPEGVTWMFSLWLPPALRICLSFFFHFESHFFMFSFIPFGIMHARLLNVTHTHIHSRKRRSEDVRARHCFVYIDSASLIQCASAKPEVRYNETNGKKCVMSIYKHSIVFIL